MESLNTYIAGFNSRLAEVAWRCEESREDIEKHGDLREIMGMIKQAILSIDLSDDTVPSGTVINAIKEKSVYLKILRILEDREGHEIATDELKLVVNDDKFDFTLDWLRDRQLIVINPSTITFGPKGRMTLEAILEEQKTN